MIGDLNFSVDNAAMLHLLNSDSMRFAPLTPGQLAAKMMFGTGGAGNNSAGGTYGTSQPVANMKDPSKYPPPSSGMSTTTMAAIGIGVVAAALIGYKLMKKR